MRSGTEVRPIHPDDVEAVVALCLTARRETWSGAQLCSSDTALVADHIGTLVGIPGSEVLVAVHEGVPAGLLLARAVGPNPFTERVSAVVEGIYVEPRHRRRGVGHALMQGMVEFAVRAGAEHVYAMLTPGARGMQRFFVRLGFTAAAAHRVTTTAALQRRLADGGRSRPRGLEELIARRRQSRSEGGGGAEARQDRSVTSRQVSRAVAIRRDAESSTAIS